MVFSSLGFFIFFGAVYAAYWLMGERRRPRLYLLFLASCFFYMTWSARLILVILYLITMDYFLARWIADEADAARRRLLLRLSIVSNLSLLGFFKYTNFLVGTAAGAAALLGYDAAPPVFDIVLPIGISFHTFQSMSYTIDVYYGKMRPTRSFVEFAAYDLFFPQLVAGPIVRAKEFLPQLSPLPRLTAENFAAGLDLFMLGMLKKVFVADRLAASVDAVFAQPVRYDAASTWCAVVCYAFQIYGDFSGYTDMARGLARIFGFRFDLNFRTPYLSRDVSDFWQRWHISLSAWLRDNLFTPLGGYRGPRSEGYRNLFLTMLLGGLWHGASWTFVAWGAYHGALLVARRLWQQAAGRGRADAGGLEGALRALWDRGLVFLLVCLGWVLFRAQSFGDAAHVFQKMLGLASGGERLISSYGLAVAGLLFLHDIAAYRVEQKGVDVSGIALGASPAARGFAYAAATVLLLVFSPHDTRPFIYFQF